MYQHLLVPVDGTPISDLNVEQAVRLAATFGAKVTFVHAIPDFAASGDGALLRTLEPEEFGERAVGETNATLAKARAAATAAGVTGETVALVSDFTAQAIVDAAVQRGCDLIVMASHGVRGYASWLGGSTTERVLRRSSVALLVTRIETREPLTAGERAMGVIRDEHRSMVAIVTAMRDLVAKPQPLDESALDLLSGMLAYLKAFPRREHHPKEELYLHWLLRQKGVDAGELLASLESQHEREYAVVEAAGGLVARARAGEGCHAELARTVSEMCKGILNHIAQEEREVFPLALQHLDDDDWAQVAEAFELNNDIPLQDMPHEDFRALFRRIANLTAAG